MAIVHDGISIPSVPTKDPDSVLDYKVTWSDWLATGEDIATSSFIVPSGLVLDSESNTINTATANISGGSVGTTYTVTNRIVTNSSPAKTEDRSFIIPVDEH